MNARTHNARQRFFVLVGVTAAVMWATTPVAFGQLENADPLPGSLFEGGDAGALSESTAQEPNVLTNYDWSAHGGLPLFTLVDPQTDNPATPEIEGDSSFGGGNKETVPDDWFYTTTLGGVTPAKANIFAGWAVVEQTAGGGFLSLAFFRDAPNGDTFLTFELNQAPAGVTWTNSVGTSIPCRQTGDVLISYEVTPGGPTDVDVKVYEWTTTAGEEHPTTVGGVTYQCGGAGTFAMHDLDDTEVEAAMNFASDIDNYLDPDDDPATPLPTTIPLGKFGEASINLIAALGGDLGDACFSFGSWQLHSRSSVSISSQLQDTLGPRPILVRNCTLEVKKALVPSTDTGVFDLDIDGGTREATNVGDAGTTGALVVSQATHTVSEFAGTGTSMTDYTSTYSCVNNGNTATAITGSGTVVTGGVPVTTGDNWVCTFTNTKKAHVKLVKETDPASDPAVFDFTATGAGLDSSALDTDPSATYPSFEEWTLGASQLGAHSFTEAAEAGWTLTGAACTGVTGESLVGRELSFSVVAGADITCTYENTKRARVTFEKVTVPAETGGAVFAFTPSESLSQEGFELRHGQSQGYDNLLPGQAYAATEAVENGYRLTGVTCDSESGIGSTAERSATITPLPGEHVTCTFENTRISTALLVVKVGAPKIVHDGDSIAFTYSVSNPSTSNGSLAITSIADDKCESVVGPTAKAGGNSDDMLDPGETWTYTCTTTAQHAWEDSGGVITNTVTVTGEDEFGNELEDEDVETTRVIHPAIAIEKSGPATAIAGDKIAYTLVVTNPGDIGFAEQTVKVGDEQCNADPVSRTGIGGDQTPESFDPGDVWTYSCSHQTQVGDLAVHNVATVEGTDELGKPVSATDDADSVLSQPGQIVLPERIVPGRARLYGPTGCVWRPFNARVRGTKVARVVFYLDGRKVKTLTRTNLKNQYVLRVNIGKLRIGVHRIVAKVTFERSSGTRAKEYRLSFQICARKLALPKFTG